MRRFGLSITVDDFLKQKETGHFFLLDVREKKEVDLISVEGALHIALSDVPYRLEEIPQEKEIIVFCHHGIRSLRAAEWLREQGFQSYSLEGGIHALSKKDPSLKTY